MYCKECGSPIADGSNFCPVCGARLGQAVASPQPAVNQQPNLGQAQQRPAQAQQGGQFQQGGQTQQAIQTQLSVQTGTFPEVPIQIDRSIWTFIFLSLITLGIYGYYFQWKLLTDTERINGEQYTTGGVTYVLLSLVTCGLYNLYCMYKSADNLQKAAPRYGLMFTEGGSTILLWYLVGLLVCCLGPFIAENIIIKNCNALGAAYNTTLTR